SDVRHAATLRLHMASDGKGNGPSVWAFLQQSRLDREKDNRLPHVADGAKVTAKTLIVLGKEDAMCSLEASTALSEAIPGAKFVVIDKCGHMPWLEKPEEFWEAVDVFLKK